MGTERSFVRLSSSCFYQIFVNQIFVEMTGQKKSSIGEMIYDPRTKTLLGRNAGSWATILAFYAVYYSFLACLFYGFMAMYMSFLPSTDGSDDDNWNGPVIRSRLDQPGAGVWPHNDFRNDQDNTNFNIGTHCKDYIKFSQEFVRKYEDATTYSNSNLKQIYEPANIIQQIDFSQRLEDGEPVVFIALNNLIGWTPINSGNMPENTPVNSFVKDAVYFDCKNVKGNKIVDDFEVVPIEGTTNYIESKWFSFNPEFVSPSGYKKPFVAMVIKSKGGVWDNGETHLFKCAILADNIQGPPMDDWFNEEHPQAKVSVGSVKFGFSYA